MSTRKMNVTIFVLLNLLWGGISLFAGTLQAATPVSKQKPMVLRMAHYQPEQRVLMVAAKWWADEVKARTNGRIVIKHYFSEKLVKAKEIVSMVARGGVELGTPALTYFYSEFPLMGSLIDYPWTSVDQMLSVVPKLVEEVPALDAEWKRNNIKPLSYGALLNYGVVSKKKVGGLEDLKGLKIRVFGKTVPIRMSKLGMVPLATPSSVAYEAIAKGTIDCSLSPLDQHRSLGLWEVAKYHVRGDFLPSMYAVQPVMNLDLFNKLEPELQKILLDLQADHLKKVKELLIEAASVDMKFLQEKGVKFINLSNADNERLNQDAMDVFEERANALKKNGLEAEVTAIKAALVKRVAEYDKKK